MEGHAGWADRIALVVHDGDHPFGFSDASLSYGSCLDSSNLTDLERLEVSASSANGVADFKAFAVGGHDGLAIRLLSGTCGPQDLRSLRASRCYVEAAASEHKLTADIGL